MQSVPPPEVGQGLRSGRACGRAAACDLAGLVICPLPEVGQGLRPGFYPWELVQPAIWRQKGGRPERLLEDGRRRAHSE